MAVISDWYQVSSVRVSYTGGSNNIMRLGT